jgi:hypothetical protein
LYRYTEPKPAAPEETFPGLSAGIAAAADTDTAAAAAAAAAGAGATRQQGAAGSLGGAAPLWSRGLVASTYAGRWVESTSCWGGHRRFHPGVEDPFAAGDNKVGGERGGGVSRDLLIHPLLSLNSAVSPPLKRPHGLYHSL